MKNVEKDLKQEIFKCIEEKIAFKIHDLERRFEQRFTDMEDLFFNSMESEGFTKAVGSMDRMQSVEHRFIHDDFNVDEFVDDIFKDIDIKSHASTTVASISSRPRSHSRHFIL